MTNENNLKEISVKDIFQNSKYIVPIYQRNYAWTSNEIEQLLDDINDFIQDSNNENKYFLGNLIVNLNNNNEFEVIDGQQRLTTLFLIHKYLFKDISSNVLKFEARNKYTKTLENLDNIQNNDEIEYYAKELIDGYKIISQYFERNKNKESFIEKLSNIMLVRVQVPKNIDLNHYFEIMNTRGEQLELHEIAKAKILNCLQDDKEDIKLATLIWDNCSIMDSYLQMNFSKNLREKIFEKNWSEFDFNNFDNFDKLKDCFKNCDNDKSEETKKSLVDIIQNKISKEKSIVEKEKVENQRFESAISFANFLLQVQSVINKQNNESDNALDDKYFLNNLKSAWENKENAKRFIYTMLKTRYLFDKYIIKRDKKDSNDGKWSLQKLCKYTQETTNTAKPEYKNTYEDNNTNLKLKTLESCLRITYTSPKTMHWITEALIHLSENEKIDLIDILEEYCRNKIRESNFKTRKGFDIPRIVFTYLDYLLFRDNYNGIISPPDSPWEFQYRTSIEHFYPQHPFNNEDKWDDDSLNSFGNLALITTSGNSKFSNYPPKVKKEDKKIINQSLKLKIMANMFENNWSKDLVKKHEKEMYDILDNEIKLINPSHV